MEQAEYGEGHADGKARRKETRTQENGSNQEIFHVMIVFVVHDGKHRGKVMRRKMHGEFLRDRYPRGEGDLLRQKCIYATSKDEK
jgi:hypothetical protein